MCALLKKSAALVLMAMLSALYFFAMILARKTLSPEDLYFWNVLVTLMSIGFTFCFLGSEQLFLRFSMVDEQRRVFINQNTLKIMIGSSLVFTTVITYLAETYFFQVGNFFIYFIIFFCVGIFVFVYNILRLHRSFALAQVAANGWKLTLFISVILAPLGDFSIIILSSLLSTCIGVVVLLIKNGSVLQVNNDVMQSNWVHLYSGFFVSLFVLMLLTNIDRLIFTRYGGDELFSEYVYLTILLILPFSILSNYLGFKEIAYLKIDYGHLNFFRRILTVGLASASLFSLWFGLIYLCQEWLEVSIRIHYGLPCAIIVVCRCAYALLSALLGLKGNPTDIHLANLITIMAIGLAVCMLLLVGVSILNVVLMVAGLWLVRLGVYLLYALKIKDLMAR